MRLLKNEGVFTADRLLLSFGFTGMASVLPAGLMLRSAAAVKVALKMMDKQFSLKEREDKSGQAKSFVPQKLTAVL